eukprot:scaffold15670_cov112-Isochrysis_galbana.AAC.11
MVGPTAPVPSRRGSVPPHPPPHPPTHTPHPKSQITTQHTHRSLCLRPAPCLVLYRGGPRSASGGGSGNLEGFRVGVRILTVVASRGVPFSSKEYWLGMGKDSRVAGPYILPPTAGAWRVARPRSSSLAVTAEYTPSGCAATLEQRLAAGVGSRPHHYQEGATAERRRPGLCRAAASPQEHVEHMLAFGVGREPHGVQLIGFLNHDWRPGPRRRTARAGACA